MLDKRSFDVFNKIFSSPTHFLKIVLVFLDTEVADPGVGVLLASEVILAAGTVTFVIRALVVSGDGSQDVLLIGIDCPTGSGLLLVGLTSLVVSDNLLMVLLVVPALVSKLLLLIRDSGLLVVLALRGLVLGQLLLDWLLLDAVDDGPHNVVDEAPHVLVDGVLDSSLDVQGIDPGVDVSVLHVAGASSCQLVWFDANDAASVSAG